MRWVEEELNLLNKHKLGIAENIFFETLSERLLVNNADIEMDLRKTVEDIMRAQSVKFKNIDVRNLLNPNEDVVREEISFESLVSSITQLESMGIKEDSEETEADSDIDSLKE